MVWYGIVAQFQKKYPHLLSSLERGCRGLFQNWWSAAEVTLLTSYMTHNHQHCDEEDHSGQYKYWVLDNFEGLSGWVWNSPLQLTSFPPRCLQAPLSFNERLSRHVFGSLFHNISWLWAKIQFEKDKLANFPCGFAFDWLSPEEAFVEVFSQHYWVLILIFIEWNGSLPNPVVKWFLFMYM